MKQRFAGIFDTRKKDRGIGAILMVGLLLSLVGGMVACSKEASDPETTPVVSNSNTLSNTNNTAVPASSTDDQQKAVPSNSVVSTDKDNFLAGQEGKAFEAAAQKFTQAFLNDDRAAMKELLIEPDNQRDYLQETLGDDVESMTLKLSTESITENAVSAQYELRFKDKSSSLQYVALQMKKVNEDWKVEFYALEQ